MYDPTDNEGDDDDLMNEIGEFNDDMDVKSTGMV